MSDEHSSSPRQRHSYAPMVQSDERAQPGGSVVDRLRRDGYAVVPGAVPASMCAAVVAAIGEVVGIELDDPATWHRAGTDLDMTPMWGHQSQWDIRQLPALHTIWSQIWGRDDLWVDINSCRVTPPWVAGAADALPIHFDVDPHDASQRWFPGLVALTDAPAGRGGFRCVPSLFRDVERWPTEWSEPDHFRPDLDASDEIVEVPLMAGDLLIWDSHLPHGTARNDGPAPRAVFYLQMHPPGSPAELADRIADFSVGQAPPWVRWKPGHDRLDLHDVALSRLGRRLLGTEAWPGADTD